MSKKIEITLVKDGNSMSISNKENNTFDVFEDDDIGRKELVQYLISEFLNKEVAGGRKYK